MKFEDLLGKIDMESGFYVKELKLREDRKGFDEKQIWFFENADDLYDSYFFVELSNMEFLFIEADKEGHLIVFVRKMN